MILPSITREVLDAAYLYGRLMVCEYEAFVRSLN